MVCKRFMDCILTFACLPQDGVRFLASFYLATCFLSMNGAIYMLHSFLDRSSSLYALQTSPVSRKRISCCRGFRSLRTLRPFFKQNFQMQFYGMLKWFKRIIYYKLSWYTLSSFGNYYFPWSFPPWAFVSGLPKPHHCIQLVKALQCGVFGRSHKPPARTMAPATGRATRLTRRLFPTANSPSYSWQI